VEAGKEWMAVVEDVDIDLRADGRVMEVLSEHLCQGWLEGYLLTGRHGLFCRLPSLLPTSSRRLSMASSPLASP